MKIAIQTKKIVEGEKTFYYTDIGSEDHGRPTFRLWVSSKLVQRSEDGEYEYVEFPIRNARIVVTEKGTKILKPAKGWNTFFILVHSGFRGDNTIEFTNENELEIFWFEVFSSPRGNLGISRGAIVCTPKEKVEYRWKRTGRLYGSAPFGITIVHLDGREEVIENIEDPTELTELE